MKLKLEHVSDVYVETFFSWGSLSVFYIEVQIIKVGSYIKYNDNSET